MMCSFFQGVMRKYFADPNQSLSHRSSRFHRAIQHVRRVQEEWGIEEKEKEQEKGEKPGKGKERLGTQNPGGEGSGAGTARGTTGGGNELPLNPRPGQLGNRQNRSRSPKRTTLVVHHPLEAGHNQEKIDYWTPPTTQATPVVRAATIRCIDHCSYRVDRVPIDFHEYICVDT